jgi:hypothetical protein
MSKNCGIKEQYDDEACEGSSTKHYHGRIIPCMMRQIRHGVLGVVAAVAGGGVVVVV